jgi:GNAT superfamily N-acetyltransferase
VATVRLVAMTQDDYDAWHDAAVAEYAMDHERSDGTTAEEALAESWREFDALLPDGPTSRGMHLFTALDALTGDDVGMIWLAERGSPERPQGFIYDIRVWPAVRSRGYGRAILAAIEPEARRLNLRRIGLHVFGHNPVAIRLYESSGYQVTDLVMAKDLG